MTFLKAALYKKQLKLIRPYSKPLEQQLQQMSSVAFPASLKASFINSPICLLSLLPSPHLSDPVDSDKQGSKYCSALLLPVMITLLFAVPLSLYLHPFTFSPLILYPRGPKSADLFLQTERSIT